MLLTGTIVDDKTNTGIPWATAQVTDLDGTFFGPGTVANSKGEFNLDIVNTTGAMILLSSAGYVSLMVPYNLFLANDYPAAALEPNFQAQPPVIVTPGKKEGNMLLWGGLGLLLIILLTQGEKHRRKVGSINSVDWQNLAIKVGIGIVAYLILVKPLLIKLGILESREDKAVKEDRNKALEDALADAERKQNATYTDGQLSSFADTLHESMRYSWIDDDYNKTVATLKKANNLTDVYKMIKFFGIRQECLFGVLCSDLTLPEMVKRNLSSSNIAAVNSYYASKNINYAW